VRTYNAPAGEAQRARNLLKDSHNENENYQSGLAERIEKTE
jgi:hypothetical protein